MKLITCNVPDSLYNALVERMETDKASCDHVVSMALSQCLGHPIHTLFQVSTSAALVEGLYQGAVRVSRLLRHGDLGLGTFIDLDGEMVVLEGVLLPRGVRWRGYDGKGRPPYSLCGRDSLQRRVRQAIPAIE